MLRIHQTSLRCLANGNTSTTSLIGAAAKRRMSLFHQPSVLRTGNGLPSFSGLGSQNRHNGRESQHNHAGIGHLRSVPPTLRGRRYYSGGFVMGDPGMVMNAYYLLLGANALVYGLWVYADLTKNQRLQARIQQNTHISVNNVYSGRWWTLLTAAFAHQDFTHILFNMFTMHTMCQILALVPGVTGAHVLSLALGSGIAGNLSFYIQHRAGVKGSKNRMEGVQHFHASAIGASGAVMGLSAVATCFVPTMPMQIMFIPINIPLWAVTAGYFAFDSYYLGSQRSRTAHAGHLGGFAFGALSYLAYFKGLAPFGLWQMARRFFK